MSAIKSGLIGAAVVCGAVGALFVWGPLKLSGPGDASVSEQADDADDAENGKRTGRKRRRRRGRRGKGQDLRSLGYLAGARPEAHKNKSGLTIHEVDRVVPGYVLYNYCGWGAGLEGDDEDRNSSGDTVLLSLEGEELHRWHSTVGTDGGGVSISKLLPNGDLVLNHADRGVARIGFDGETVWQLSGVYHHDLAVEDDESVWVLSERKLGIEGSHRGFILDHGLTHISQSGVALQTLWFSDTLAEEPVYQRILARVGLRNGRVDLHHANAVEILTEDGPGGLWKKGDILSSLRNLNIIVVVQRDTGKLLWIWGRGDLQHQHGPVLTGDGTFLVFDNGPRRGKSRVLEIDPLTKQIGWTYEGTPDNPFFSRARGTVQPLSGGHVFVGSSNDGRMFQVDRQGDIVWEYWTQEKHGGKVVPIRAGFVTGSLKEAIDVRLGIGTQPQEAVAGEDEPAAEDAGASVSEQTPTPSDTTPLRAPRRGVKRPYAGV